MLDIEELLKSGISIQIKPKGTSMFPFIIAGRDEVIIEPTDISKLHRGDIVLYRRSNGPLVLHRMHHKKDHAIFTVGDNQVIIEGPIYQEQIKGKMIARISVTSQNFNNKGDVTHTIAANNILREKMDDKSESNHKKKSADTDDFNDSGRQISVYQPLYYISGHIWLVLRPIRPYIRKIARIMKHIFIKIRGRS